MIKNWVDTFVLALGVLAMLTIYSIWCVALGVYERIMQIRGKYR